MASEEIVIPARIIYNWDYKKYPVSQSAFNCLNEIKDDPLVDFKTANPYIYTAVDEMSRLQTLRNQLNYLRAYLFTCREPVIEELQKMMYPKEYMYEHIHQYSVSVGYLNTCTLKCLFKKCLSGLTSNQRWRIGAAVGESCQFRS